VLNKKLTAAPVHQLTTNQPLTQSKL